MQTDTLISLSESLYKLPPRNGRYYTIAVDGRAGSGKTEFTQYLSKLLPGFIFLHGDDYFEPTPGAIAWGAFNEDRFSKDVIEPLEQGETIISYRPYDWHKEPHIAEHTIKINKGICLERSYSFSFNIDWDLKVWIETPPNIATQRAYIRDQMPSDQAKQAYEQVWKPQDEAHFAKFKPLKTANLVVDGTKSFSEQVKP